MSSDGARPLGRELYGDEAERPGLKRDRVQAGRADLGLERDALLRRDALAGHFHECEDIAGRRAPSIHDEVGALRRDFNGLDALAAKSHPGDELGRRFAAVRIPPHVAERSQGQRLRCLLELEVPADLLVDLLRRAAREWDTTPEDEAPGWERVIGGG